MTPAPEPSNGPADFARLINTAIRARTPDRDLRSGVDVYGLCHYAAGDVPAAERIRVHHQLLASPWAMSRVIALVKGARTPGSLATTVLEAARSGDWSGLLASGPDSALELARLLDAL